jgi:hypothetical protein
VGEWAAVREGTSAARAAIACALGAAAAAGDSARRGRDSMTPGVGEARSGPGRAGSCGSQGSLRAHADSELPLPSREAEKKAEKEDAVTEIFRRVGSANATARGKKGKARGKKKSRALRLPSRERDSTDAVRPTHEQSAQPASALAAEIGDGTSLQTLAQAYHAAARALSWKERLKRRLSHSTEGQTAATLLRIESVCPNCKHVICTEACLDMSTMRTALTAWMQQVVYRAQKQLKRAPSSSSCSSKSENENPLHHSSHKSLTRASSMGSSNHTDQDLGDDDTSSEDETNPNKPRSTRRTRALKMPRRCDASRRLVPRERVKTGTAERLIQPAPEHYVGLMDGGQNDGGEPFLSLDNPSSSAQVRAAEKRAREIGSDRLAFNSKKVVVFLRKDRQTVLNLKERKHSGQSSAETEVRPIQPFYVPVNSADTTLVFESRFESGNLFRATKVGTYEYDLRLCSDSNTTAHIQWFYFAVSNTRKGTVYRINIVNMLKPVSMYGKGLMPLLYSSYAAEKHGLGWHRTGSNISYRTNGGISKQTMENGSTVRVEYLRTLSFDVEFPANHDTSYLAHCFPYTFTDLQVFLNDLQATDMTAMSQRAAAATAAASATTALSSAEVLPPMSASSTCRSAANADTTLQTPRRRGGAAGAPGAVPSTRSTASPPFPFASPEVHETPRALPSTFGAGGGAWASSSGSKWTSGSKSTTSHPHSHPVRSAADVASRKHEAGRSILAQPYPQQEKETYYTSKRDLLMIQVEAVSRNHTLTSFSDRVTGSIEARDKEGRGTRVRQKGSCFRKRSVLKREGRCL